MKKILAAAALLSMATVHAEELKFGDLNYFIPTGSFNLSASADLSSDEINNDGDTMEKEGWMLDTLLTYGVSDRLNLYVGLGYAYDMEVTNETTNDARYTNDGLKNPLLGGVYRLISQKDGALNFDVGATASINIIDQELGSANGGDSEDGNAAIGRNSLDVYARFGHKWNEANEWQVTGGVIHHFAGEYEINVPNASATEVEEEASTDFYLRGAYQYRPINEFMMVVSVQATQVGELEDEEKSSGSESTYDAHLDWDFNFSAKYLITSNFIGRFNYGVSRNSDFDVDSDAGDYEVKNRREQHIGVGIDWLF